MAKKEDLVLPTRTRMDLPNMMLGSQTELYILFDFICRKSIRAGLTCSEGDWGVATPGMILNGREHERASWGGRNAVYPDLCGGYINVLECKIHQAAHL